MKKKYKKLGLSEGVSYDVMEGLPEATCSSTAVAVEFPYVCEVVVSSEEWGPQHIHVHAHVHVQVLIADKILVSLTVFVPGRRRHRSSYHYPSMYTSNYNDSRSAFRVRHTHTLPLPPSCTRQTTATHAQHSG